MIVELFSFGFIHTVVNDGGATSCNRLTDFFAWSKGKSYGFYYIFHLYLGECLRGFRAESDIETTEVGEHDAVSVDGVVGNSLADGGDARADQDDE